MMQLIRRPTDVVDVGLFVSILVLFAYLGFALVLRGAQTEIPADLSKVIDCSDSTWAGDLDIPIDRDSGCPNAVDLSIGLEEFDVDSEFSAQAMATVYPSGAYGGNIANGAWALKSIIVTADATGFGEWLIPSNSFVGTQSLKLPLSPIAELKNYPFDSYTTSLTGLTVDAVSGERIPVVQTVMPTQVAGFDVTVNRQTLDATVEGTITANPMGRFGLMIDISRDPSVKFQVLLLTATAVLGALAAVLLSVLVLIGKRPPTISGLSWLATFLFALLEVRRNYPGSPPIGIRIDAWVTLPVVTVIAALIVLNAALWLTRSDWDLKNRIRVND